MALGLLNLLWSLIRGEKSADLPKPVLDPCLGDARASALRAQLQAGEFAAAEAQLAQAPDIETLDHWVRAASHWPERPAWLEQWVLARPDSGWAQLLRGLQGIQWAWTARGNAVATEVAQSAWPMFLERLQKAMADLDAAATRQPDNPLPSAYAITALLGLGEHSGQMQACFERTLTLAPTLPSAHLAMHMALCEKWGGSHAEMFAFARQSAPKSPALRLLIAAAHIEQFIGFDEPTQRREYARRPDVQRELESAFASFRACTHPASRITGANYFAFAFCICGNGKLASEAFALAGPWVQRMPWCYIGDPIERFTHFRERMR